MLATLDIALPLSGAVSDDWAHRFSHLDGCNTEYDAWSEKERLVNDRLTFCAVSFRSYYTNSISGKHAKRTSCKTAKHPVWNQAMSITLACIDDHDGSKKDASIQSGFAAAYRKIKNYKDYAV